MKQFLTLFLAASLCLCANAQPQPAHNLRYDKLATQWDEAFPLGNGLLGALVWQKNGRLRLALDRADLWDLRPMKGLDRPEFNYKWVAEQAAKGNYALVQQYFDAPYEQEPGPTKLPGAALEFDSEDWGAASGELDITRGLATLKFKNGVQGQVFVHADRREGWFRLIGPETVALLPQLIAPAYNGPVGEPGGSVRGDQLARLGYHQSEVLREKNMLIYHQPCWGGFSYEVAVTWQPIPGGIEGVWSISSHFKQKTGLPRASELVRKALKRGFNASLAESKRWWSAYWEKSALHIPDPLLERQYYLDQYKFGCVARANAPMISLQAVWTADNGLLPPWKGDFHHDLNTQLSYWPAYTANHLEEARGYLNHVESNDAAHRAYTKRYFSSPGLNVPGVETLLGEPMGGWIQYSCSPTTSAWLAQHFYLQWRYSQDQTFLKYHAWPFLRDVALHLETVTYLNKDGVRVLPLSSSPEINDNSLTAWFPNTWTNYDLALTRFVFAKTAELAEAVKQPEAAAHWNQRLAELPPFSLTETGALKFAPTLGYQESHRHFSHLMAVHPLGLIDWSNGTADQRIMTASLQQLENQGADWWTGYSFAWEGNLFARARDGAGARKALHTFAEAFVSKNSFHVNGDQSGKGYSKFTYRPFTLEGNFAFAAGIQEMLLQSQNGVLDAFPAVPEDWKDVSFQHLRAEGAFLVSAERKQGQLSWVEIVSEKGGLLKIQLPMSKLQVYHLSGGREIGQSPDGMRQFQMKKGGRLVLSIP